MVDFVVAFAKIPPRPCLTKNIFILQIVQLKIYASTLRLIFEMGRSFIIIVIVIVIIIIIIIVSSVIIIEPALAPK